MTLTVHVLCFYIHTIDHSYYFGPQLGPLGAFGQIMLERKSNARGITLSQHDQARKCQISRRVWNRDMFHFSHVLSLSRPPLLNSTFVFARGSGETLVPKRTQLDIVCHGDTHEHGFQLTRDKETARTIQTTNRSDVHRRRGDGHTTHVYRTQGACTRQ